jgi:hypothetical protein
VFIFIPLIKLLNSPELHCILRESETEIDTQREVMEGTDGDFLEEGFKPYNHSHFPAILILIL